MSPKTEVVHMNDMQNQDNSDMASDNVDYPSDSIDGWRTMVTQEEENKCASWDLQSHAVNNLEFRDYFKKYCTYT